MSLSPWTTDPPSPTVESARLAQVQRDETEDRPRKRPRSQSPVEDLHLPESSEDFQHDPNYYFEDGSTVIRVENVLFKVYLRRLAALP